MRANLLMIFLANVMLAQNGSLDASFGNSGIVTIQASYAGAEMQSVILQPDGKIIAYGSTFDFMGIYEYFIIRYNNDGTLDQTFGINGRIESNYLDYTKIEDVQLQPNGKIIAKVYHNNSNFLLRFNQNGNLDTGFGTNGTLSLPNTSIASFTLQTNGKLLLSEVPIANANLGYRLLRYNANGILDTGFGTNGFVFIPAVNGGNLYAVLLLDNGKKLLSGRITVGSNSDIGIVRYKSDWTFDDSFGIGGKAIVNLDDNDVQKEIKIQDNDKIVLAIQSYHESPPFNFVFSDKLVRLKANGRIDSGFGTLGVITPPVEPFAMKVQSDGKLVVAGGIPYQTASGRFVNEVGLTRYRKNGNVDNSFGTNGIIRTQSIVLFGHGEQNQHSSIAIQPDGKMVLGAAFCEEALSCHPHSLVLRYNANQATPREPSGIPIANSGDPAFTVYPNPVNESFDLNFKLTQSESLSIDLYDSNGRAISNLIRETRFEPGANTLKLALPGSLSHGIYILTVSNGSYLINVKIVK